MTCPTDQLLTNSSDNPLFLADFGQCNKKARTRKSLPYKHLGCKAGERIRTADVQLGKLVPNLADWLVKPLTAVA